MHVVRAGGHYLEGREQRLWLSLASVIGLGTGGFVLAAWGLRVGSPLRWAGIAGVLSTLPLGAKVIRRLTSVRKGRLGERLVTELLERLPDDYWLVNDITLDGTRGNIDHVLVGPCGVMVIETKRLAGLIRCRGDAWYVNGFPYKSISQQVNSGAGAVQYYLAERLPDLAPQWVESVVVFTHALCSLKIDRPRTRVVRYSELLQVVRELARKNHTTAARAAQLAETLARSQTAPTTTSSR